MENNESNDEKSGHNSEIMKKVVRTESFYLLVLLAIFILIFKIVFYKENCLKLVWAVVSFFLTFTVPGFILCYLWFDKLDFTERFIAGNIIGLISVGILSYNLNIWLGVNIKTVGIITPIIAAVIYGGIVYFSERKKKDN